jgi:threonine dehydrogenase-like Zn-dependent dehydrogenase
VGGRWSSGLVEPVAEASTAEIQPLLPRRKARQKIPMMEHGDILGHEFMGIVEEVGPAVLRVKKRDRVVIPFTISCGQCFYCNLKLFDACETTNTGRGEIVNRKDTKAGAALFGYSTCMAAFPAARPSWCACPRPTWARW